MSGALDILVVAGRYPLASETFVRQQCLGLMRLGHRVEVLALAAGDGAYTARERDERLPERTRCAHLERGVRGRLAGIPSQWLRLATRSPRAALAAFSPRHGRRAMSGQLLAIADAIGAPRRFDAIHCQFGPAGIVGMLMRRAGLVEGPLSVAFYGFDVTREPLRAGPGVYDALFREASLLLPISDDLGRRLVALGAPQAKVRTHRLGIDTELFRPIDRSTRAGATTALAVGRFVEKKGFDVLLRAVARSESGDSLRLRLVGDGPMRGALEGLARELGIAHRVDFIGWRTSEEVAAEMAAADLLVVPSVTARDGDMEGAPLVLLEAMASGLPAIGSRHGGIPELVGHGENGLLVDERDAGGLAEALGRFADPALRARFGEAARRRVEREFDGRIQSGALARLLSAGSSQIHG